MMELDQEQYAKIARWLDGSSEGLADAERAVADEISDLERKVAGELAVELPQGAIFRLNAKVSHAAAPRPRRGVWRGVVFGFAAAAAALLAVGLNHVLRPVSPRPVSTPPGPVARAPAGKAPTDQAVRDWARGLAKSAPRSDWDVKLDELGREMGELEAESFASASPVDVEMDALESDFNELLMDDTWPRTPGM